MKKIESVLLLFIVFCLGFASYLIVGMFVHTDVDTLNSALVTGDITDCSKISDATLKDTCQNTIAINQAIKSDDVGVCGLSSNYPGCQYAFYTNKAKTLNDLSYCSFTDINRCRDEYYLNSAVLTKDKFKCSFIVDLNLRKVCEGI